MEVLLYGAYPSREWSSWAPRCWWLWVFSLVWAEDPFGRLLAHWTWLCSRRRRPVVGRSWWRGIAVWAASHSVAQAMMSTRCSTSCSNVTIPWAPRHPATGNDGSPSDRWWADGSHIFSATLGGAFETIALNGNGKDRNRIESFLLSTSWVTRFYFLGSFFFRVKSFLKYFF